MLTKKQSIKKHLHNNDQIKHYNHITYFTNPGSLEKCAYGEMSAKRYYAAA